jgi:hypothetical protein
MVGDLTFDVDVMGHAHVPGLGRRRHLLDSTCKINMMREKYPDLVILPAHDPGAAGRLVIAEQAPANIPRRKTCT